MSDEQANSEKRSGKERRKGKPAGRRNNGNRASHLGLYIIALSVLSLAANYVLAYEWAWMEAIMGRFLPPDMPRPSSEIWRPLVLLIPAATVVLGFLVHKHGKRVEALAGNAIRDAHGMARHGYTLLDYVIKYQAEKAPDKVSVDRLRGDLRRLRFVALLNSMFSEHEGTSVFAPDYLRQVSRETAKEVAPDLARLSLDLAPVQLEYDTALACGLIVSELVSNCLRFAFRDIKRPEILVSFSMIGSGMAELSVKDNGIGIPTRMDEDKLITLGLKLVRKLVNQLKGKLDITVFDGTTMRVRFPL